MTPRPAAGRKWTCRTCRSSGTVNASHHSAAIRNAIRTPQPSMVNPSCGRPIITAMATTNGSEPPTYPQANPAEDTRSMRSGGLTSVRNAS